MTILIILAVVVSVVMPLKGKQAFASIKKSGLKDSVLIMEKGNLKLAFSRIHEDMYQFVRAAPYVKKKDGEPLVAPCLQMSSVYGDKFLALRGVTDVFFKARGKNFEIIEGKNLKDPYDVIIGKLLSHRMEENFRVGQQLSIENKEWTIVGIYRAKGDPAESGAIVRLEDFKEVTARDVYSYVEMKVDDVQNMQKMTGYINKAFTALHDEFPDAPAIMALPEKEYWAKLAKVFKMSVMISKATAVIITVSVLLFLLNVSHSSFLKRQEKVKEAIKNGKGSYLGGVLVGVLVFSAVAGIIGGLIAMSFHGRPVNLQLSTILLRVEPSVLPRAIIMAILFGIVGNLPFLIMAAREK
ncbi:ABC transporter permease [Acidobacteriota bacterium]